MPDHRMTEADWKHWREHAEKMRAEWRNEPSRLSKALSSALGTIVAWAIFVLFALCVLLPLYYLGGGNNSREYGLDCTNTYGRGVDAC